MCRTRSIIQFENDIRKQALIQTHILQPPSQERLVRLVRMIRTYERMLGQQDQQLRQLEELCRLSRLLQVEGAAVDGAGVGELETLLHRPRSHQLAEGDHSLALGLHVADALEGGMVQFSTRGKGLAAGATSAGFLFGTDETFCVVGEITQGTYLVQDFFNVANCLCLKM